MEYGVIQSDLTEKEIKPRELINTYFSLIAKDNSKYFPGNALHETSCPACGTQDRHSAFLKYGMEYSSCNRCITLYVNPRPSQEQIETFFKESEARKFWLDQLWKKTSIKRFTKTVEPLLQWVQTFLDECGSSSDAVVADVYPSNWSLYEGWKQTQLFSKLIMVEPLFSLQLNEDANLKKSAVNLSTSEKFDAVCLIDALGRVESPKTALNWVADHLKPGGLCFITAVLSSGFDVMVLGAHADALVPPDHLNLFSYEGLLELFNGSPFEVLEMSTPGVLDLQNIKQQMSKTDADIPDFLKYIFNKRQDPELERAFQEFLQSQRLSSLARAVLQKKS